MRESESRNMMLRPKEAPVRKALKTDFDADAKCFCRIVELGLSARTPIRSHAAGAFDILFGFDPRRLSSTKTFRRTPCGTKLHGALAPNLPVR